MVTVYSGQLVSVYMGDNEQIGNLVVLTDQYIILKHGNLEQHYHRTNWSIRPAINAGHFNNLGRTRYEVLK